MKTKEYYEAIAKDISFSNVKVDVENKFVHFHTDLGVLNKNQMNKIMEMTENSIDFNFWCDNGFTLNIHF